MVNYNEKYGNLTNAVSMDRDGLAVLGFFFEVRSGFFVVLFVFVWLFVFFLFFFVFVFAFGGALSCGFFVVLWFLSYVVRWDFPGFMCFMEENCIDQIWRRSNISLCTKVYVYGYMTGSIHEIRDRDGFKSSSTYSPVIFGWSI